MKAVMLAAQSISLGYRGAMVAGGFESMSNAPYYLPKARTGLRLGHGAVVDGEACSICLVFSLFRLFRPVRLFRLIRLLRLVCLFSLLIVEP